MNSLAPRTLFWRSLLIVVLPLVLLQLVLTDVFYNRHWDTVTRWLAAGVAGDVALLAEELEADRDPAARDAAIDRARRHTDLRIAFEPGGKLQTALASIGVGSGPRGHIDEKILEAFQERLALPFAVDLRGEATIPSGSPSTSSSRTACSRGAPRKRVTSTTTWLLVAWMVGASLLLAASPSTSCASRSDRSCASPVPPRASARVATWATSVPPAPRDPPGGAAFNLMRQRILRHLGQRTELLAAVSHDLRTPLTRMRLELELMGGEATRAFADLRPTSRR